MTRRRSALAAATALVLLFATACGSTVHSPSEAQGAPAAAGGGLSVPSTSQGSSSGVQPGSRGTVGGGSSGGGSIVGGTSSGGTTGGGTSSGGGTSGGGSSSEVPGITPTTIYLGARYLKNQDTANAALGAGGAGGGDARDAYKAVIGEINANGGIAGRKVVPVFAAVDVASNTPVQQQEQANCSTWTQDHEVFAILAARDAIDWECAKRAGIAQWDSDLSGGGTLPETYREYPRLVSMAAINLVRLGPVTVDGLATQGYFDSGAKIGMLTWDLPAYKEGLQKGFLPALARHHLHLADDPVYLTPPQTLADVSATSAQVNSAVLRFQSEGIDHVMMLDGSAGLCGVGCMGFLFMRRAQSQRYFPRYGFNDLNVPAAGYAANFYPAEELKGSLAVGWDDLDKTYDDGWHVNAMREQCYDLMRKHGVAIDDVNKQSAALGACDELWFFQKIAATLGTNPLTPDNVIAAVNSFGTSYPSTETYGTNFSADQHDGIDLVRNYKFVQGCKCFRYTSGAYRPG